MDVLKVWEGEKEFDLRYPLCSAGGMLCKSQLAPICIMRLYTIVSSCLGSKVSLSAIDRYQRTSMRPTSSSFMSQA